jgi:hypothetical protein
MNRACELNEVNNRGYQSQANFAYAIEAANISE